MIPHSGKPHAGAGFPQVGDRRVRCLRALVLAVTLAAATAACVQTEKKGVNLPESRWTEDRVAELVNPPAQAAEAPEMAEPPPVPKRKPAEAQVAALPPEPEAPEIESLVGLDFDATQTLLGEPSLDNVQAPARIWAYNGTGCVLSIFFYPTVDGETYRALTYEVKGVEEDPDKIQACFSELVREKRGT